MEEQIKKWKKQYGKIYSVELLGNTYIFRSLLMGEYHNVSKEDDVILKEQIILNHGVLHPLSISISNIPSGVAEKLVLYISQATGISEKSILDKVQEKRDQLGITDDYLKWKTKIIQSLNYTPDQVDSMSFDKFIESLVMAEEVLQTPLVAVGSDEAELPQSELPTGPPEEGDAVLPLNKGESPRPVLENQAAETVDQLRRVYSQEKKRRVISG